MTCQPGLKTTKWFQNVFIHRGIDCTKILCHGSKNIANFDELIFFYFWSRVNKIR